jgi:hypothetical protein
MKEEQMIDLLNEVRREPNRRQLIKDKLLSLFCVSNCPDLTDVWNLAEKLSRLEQITIWEMNEVWVVLNEIEKDGKCKLADFFD